MKRRLYAVWKLLKRAAPIFVLALVCASITALVCFRYSENVARKHVADERVAQQQTWNAGCSDDNSKLQSWVIELERGNQECLRQYEKLAQECLRGHGT